VANDPPAAGEGNPETAALAALDDGDRDRVLEILMAAYGEPLYRFCRQLTGDAELAEEVHQATFVQAHDALPRFRRRSTLKTWLFGIARHRSLDAIKKRRRFRRRFTQVETLPEPATADAEAEDGLVARDRRAALRSCLETLAPRVRSAVLLRYQEGFSYVDMARVSGDRPPTLQARVSRALPVLRRCLEERGVAW